MIKRMPYFKCYPSDFLVGTQGMNRDDFANYVRLIFLMYEHGGPLRFDPAWLRFALGYRRSSDVVSAVQRLIDLGKISLDSDGRIHNGRTDYEMAVRTPEIKPEAPEIKPEAPEIKPEARWPTAKKSTNSTRARARSDQNRTTSTNVDVSRASARANKPKNLMLEEVKRRIAARQEDDNGDGICFLLPPQGHN